MIEVILLERIGRLGQIGQVVKVKPGFARNYLLPRKKALRATKDNMAFFESQRSNIEAANADARSNAQKQGEKLAGKMFVVIRQASDVGQLFGSVTVRDVAEQLHLAGYETERQNILLAAPIKTLGLHKIDVSLHPEVTVNVVVNIARTEDEAKVQEKTGQAVKLAAERAEQAAKADAEALAEQAKAMFEEKTAADEEVAEEKPGTEEPEQA
jgi:large subunit ribosomal protein L9